MKPEIRVNEGQRPASKHPSCQTRGFESSTRGSVRGKPRVDSMLFFTYLYAIKFFVEKMRTVWGKSYFSSQGEKNDPHFSKITQPQYTHFSIFMHPNTECEFYAQIYTRVILFCLNMSGLVFIFDPDAPAQSCWHHVDYLRTQHCCVKIT